MADFTKNAIRASFMKLLNEKPLKQITVKDIVDDCGINRNTFYYHFQDVPALIETILEEDSTRLLLHDPDINTVEDCLNVIVDMVLRNRTAVLHIYKSVNRDFFEQYHWRVCDRVVHAYLEKKLQNVRISELDRTVLIAYTKSLVFGVVMGWLETDLKDDIHVYIHRICQLKQGDLDTMIEKMQNSTT